MNGTALRCLVLALFALLLTMPPRIAGAETALPVGYQAGYTGLIIVDTVAHLDRSMSPAVLTPRGEVVYGRGWWKPGQLNPDFVDKYGIVEYAPSIAAAGRAGARPLVVFAIGVSGPPFSTLNTDLVIREDDAFQIRAADAQGRFLENYRVSIVAQTF